MTSQNDHSRGVFFHRAKRYFASNSALSIWLLRILRTAAIIAPFAWIYAQLDYVELEDVLREVPLWVLAMALLSPLLPMALQAFRWWVLLRTAAIDLSLWKTIECHFAASFYALVLPGASAQEIVRAVLLSRQVDYAVVWGSTWLSKLLGLVGWMVVGLLGLAIEAQLLNLGSFDVRALLLASAAVLSIALAASFSKRLTRPIRLLSERIVPTPLLKKLAVIRDAVYVFRTQYRALIYAIITTLCIQLSLVLGTAIVLYGIIGQFFFWPFAAILALIEVTIVIVPLTPGGIGIREGLLALLFTHIGIGTEEVSVYIALCFLGTLSRLVGGISVALGRISKNVETPAKID